MKAVDTPRCVCMRCVYPCFYHIYVVCHVIGKLSMRVLEGVKIGSGWACVEGQRWAIGYLPTCLGVEDVFCKDGMSIRPR